jgi:hypothetical protein
VLLTHRILQLWSLFRSMVLPKEEHDELTLNLSLLGGKSLLL